MSKAKVTWSKKEGLDLRWDKTKILKKQLKVKGRNSKEIPVVQDPQVHKAKDNYIRPTRDYKNIKNHEKFRKRTMRMISYVGATADMKERGIRLRKVEARVYHFLTNSGSFTEQEADKIVEAYMISREREDDPNHHPLQTFVPTSRKYKCESTIHNTLVFSDATLRRALRSWCTRTANFGFISLFACDVGL